LLDTVLSSNRTVAQVPVDVTNSDIDGLAITLAPGVTVPIRVTVEGQDLTSIPNYDRLRVFLRPTNSSTNTSTQRGGLSPEGTSTLANIGVGEYRVQMSLPTPDLYLKEVTFERDDILNNPWQVTSRTAGTLSIVVSNKSGQIDGNVVDALSQPVKGNLVVAIPDQGRDRPELYRTAQTDPNGHYTLRGIPPGSYKVFSWEALETNAYYDKDVLAQYEGQGKPIRIQESSKETADLKLIAAPK
jgi:hypothetical protein